VAGASDTSHPGSAAATRVDGAGRLTAGVRGAGSAAGRGGGALRSGLAIRPVHPLPGMKYPFRARAGGPHRNAGAGPGAAPQHPVRFLPGLRPDVLGGISHRADASAHAELARVELNRRAVEGCITPRLGWHRLILIPDFGQNGSWETLASVLGSGHKGAWMWGHSPTFRIHSQVPETLSGRAV
jgi:hypothetical protein